MSFKKAFNVNYFKQNIKKSVGVIAVILMIVPALIFINMMSLTFGNTYSTFRMSDISAMTIFNMYFVPIILSITLFGFVFRKRSVDFVGSMPISKGSIFITNTFGGILVLLLLNIINVIIISIFNIIFANVIIPWSLIVDYFILWNITYIFVFSATNIAMAISGNAITQVIVTFLILFLIPFIHSHVTGDFGSSYTMVETSVTCEESGCIPTEYYCYDDNCNNDRSKNVYHAPLYNKSKNYNYTLPYAITAYNFLNMDMNLDMYSLSSLIKMVVLAITYVMVGHYLFKRRKMEECETSFKSIHKHTIVKLLTMYFLFAMMFRDGILNLDLVIILIMIVLILGYFFIYDLITRRGIRDLKISMIYFCFFIVMMIIWNASINYFHSNKDIKFNVKDIENITVVNNEVFDYLGGKIYSSNREFINSVVKSWLNKGAGSQNSYVLNFEIQLKNGKKYVIDAYMDDNKKLYEMFNENNQLIEAYKKQFNENPYAVYFAGRLHRIDKYHDLLKIIDDKVENLTIENIIPNFDMNENKTLIGLYYYDDHKVKIMNINLELTDELKEYIAKAYNMMTVDAFKKKATWFYVEKVAYSNSKQFILEEYRYLMEADADIYKDFIDRESKKEVDLKKDYIVISFYYNNYNASNLRVYTNNIDEYERLINESRNRYKNAFDYQNILEAYSGLYNSQGIGF